MRMRGKLHEVSRAWDSKKLRITFEIAEGNPQELDSLVDKDLQIEAKRYSDKRPGKANRLLWACIQDITYHLRAENKDPNLDKWDVYLGYIKRFGECELLRIRPEHFDKLQNTWRECEVIGHPVENGIEYLDVLCYYGSSTYNSREFSRLLDDIIADMKAAGIPTPPSEEMKRALAEIEERENGKETV